MTLLKWFKDAEVKFSLRELAYMHVHHVRLQVQLKDAETGQIMLHDVRYSATGAPEFTITTAAGR